jgi:hypothetical protein
VALAEAVNGRDVQSVKGFLHPSLVVKTTAGSLICYDDFLSLFVEPLFNSNWGWREEVEIGKYGATHNCVRHNRFSGWYF